VLALGSCLLPDRRCHRAPLAAAQELGDALRPDSSALVGRRSLSAAFKAGKSALGHHWVLFDGPDAIGRTKLVYESGGAKTLGRLGRATGIVTKGVTHATITDATEAECFRLHSYPKDKRVEVTDARGSTVGEAQRTERTLTIHADGGPSVATITRPDDKEVKQFPVVASQGGEVAVLSTEYLGQSKVSTVESAASAVELVDFFTLNSHGGSFNATMHLGFAGSREYHVRVDEPIPEPLRTLVVLSPVLAAYVF
jgi:hypothetical protein